MTSGIFRLLLSGTHITAPYFKNTDQLSSPNRAGGRGRVGYNESKVHTCKYFLKGQSMKIIATVKRETTHIVKAE
jgi:hypothetical protein